MREIECEVNEALQIGEKTVVRILDIHPDHVRVAVATPGEDPLYEEHTLYLQPQGRSAQLPAHA